MTWNKKRHAAARKRCEDATAGPWAYVVQLTSRSRERARVFQYVRAGISGPGTARGKPIIADCGKGGVTPGGSFPHNRDAAFIAYARTDLPDALDEIERLQAELAKFAPPAGMKHTMSLYQPDQP